MNFSARLTCPLGDPEKNKGMRFGVDDGSLGARSVALSLAQNLCTWEGFQINGVDVTESLMTGMGPFFADGTWSAEGYDFGRLSNGDTYLAQWSERGDSKIIRGRWKLLLGTGTLQGIKGEGTFEELAPKPGDKSVVAILTGWYILP
jgi:hypothetical protein